MIDYEYEYHAIQSLVDELEYITKREVETGTDYVDSFYHGEVRYFCIHRKKKQHLIYIDKETTGSHDRRQIEALKKALRHCIEEQKDPSLIWTFDKDDFH